MNFKKLSILGCTALCGVLGTNIVNVCYGTSLENEPNKTNQQLLNDPNQLLQNNLNQYVFRDSLFTGADVPVISEETVEELTTALNSVANAANEKRVTEFDAGVDGSNENLGKYNSDALNNCVVNAVTKGKSVYISYEDKVDEMVKYAVLLTAAGVDGICYVHVIDEDQNNICHLFYYDDTDPEERFVEYDDQGIVVTDKNFIVVPKMGEVDENEGEKDKENVINNEEQNIINNNDINNDEQNIINNNNINNDEKNIISNNKKGSVSKNIKNDKNMKNVIEIDDNKPVMNIIKEETDESSDVNKLMVDVQLIIAQNLKVGFTAIEEKIMNDVNVKIADVQGQIGTISSRCDSIESQLASKVGNTMMGDLGISKDTISRMTQTIAKLKEEIDGLKTIQAKSNINSGGITSNMINSGMYGRSNNMSRGNNMNLIFGSNLNPGLNNMRNNLNSIQSRILSNNQNNPNQAKPGLSSLQNLVWNNNQNNSNQAKPGLSSLQNLVRNNNQNNSNQAKPGLSSLQNLVRNNNQNKPSQTKDLFFSKFQKNKK